MARGQGDYYQATRGGGHGDYRHMVLAPADSAEAVALMGTAFDLAERWRNPVLVMGDYYLAHTARSVTIPDPVTRPVPEWALDGSSGGIGSRQAGLLPRHAPSSATTSATTWPPTTRLRRATAAMAASRATGRGDRHRRRRGGRRGLRHPGPVRPGRRPRAAGRGPPPSAACGRSPCSLSRPRRCAGPAAGRGPSPSTRTTRAR